MPVIGTDQVTIIDLTDGYSVNMSPESYAFPAGVTNALAGSVQTTITALVGTTIVPATVAVGSITAPSGISVTSDAASPSPTLTITIATSVTQPGVVVVPVVVGEVTIVKRFAYSLAKTGSPGASGTSPINVIQGVDALAIPTNSSGSTTTSSTVTVPFGAYSGTSRVATTALTVSTLPSGITAGTPTHSTTSADGSIALTIANGSTLGGTNNGEITLTYTVTGGQVVVRRISWAKALAGTGGSNGTSAINLIVGNDAATIPTNSTGATVSASTITIPFGTYQGTTRVASTSVTISGLPAGITEGTKTQSTASADGSVILNVANGSTLGGASSGNITCTFVVSGVTFVRYFSWSKALAGTNGVNGADAIVMAVTSSNGTIFKNSAIATTLTARVYKGGSEVTGAALTALGVISWYKDGNPTPVGTGPTLVIDAGQVTNKAIYEARMDG